MLQQVTIAIFAQDHLCIYSSCGISLLFCSWVASVKSMSQSLAAGTAAEQARANKAKHRVTLPCLLLPAQLLAAAAQS